MKNDLNVLDQQVMLAVLRLHPDAYGVSIQEKIAEKTGNTPSTGSLYASLERLEGKGYLTSRLGEPTAERGGRRKLYFTMTATGQASLSQSLTAVDSLRRGLKLKELRT